jgi:hypothetical protein
MTVIAMSRTEIDRMSVLQDLATSRIKIAEAATLMGLGRRQVFRLAKAYAQRGPAALVSRKRGRPSNHAYPADLRDAAIGGDRFLDFQGLAAGKQRSALRRPPANHALARRRNQLGSDRAGQPLLPSSEVRTGMQSQPRSQTPGRW